MNAGRELDALVAEKVMGATWRNITKGGRKRCLSFVASRPLVTIEEKKTIYHGYNQDNLPHYSTDISAAWEVVEEFRRGWQHKKAAAVIDLHISDIVDMNDSHVSIYAPDIKKVEAWGNTIPLAICLAALKAVGVEVDINA